ncbi:hypothetical protein BS78_09G149900 [Paspalum vaginatum]|nr:hypothetical protein BS78_09G149900 [Paspalum vaginatum]
MNVSLLAKWIFRIDSAEDSPRRDFPAEREGVLSVKEWCEKGSEDWGWKTHSINWEDVWTGEITLKLFTPWLYNICSEKETSVARAKEREWCLNFRRNFGYAELVYWEELQSKLSLVDLYDQAEPAMWAEQR